MSPLEAHATLGSFAWIEGSRARGRGGFGFLVALVRAAYATWEEDHWIVRRAFYRQFPRKAYLDKLGVPYAKAELEYRIFGFLPSERRVLSIVFDSADGCVGSLEDDRPDERYLVLEAIPRDDCPTPKDALTVQTEDAAMASMKSVTRGECCGAVVCDPNEGIARVFSTGDAAVRFQKVIESLQCN